VSPAIGDRFFLDRCGPVTGAQVTGTWTVSCRGVKPADAIRALTGGGRVATMSIGVQRFPFRFDPAYRRVARLFGITPSRAWVDIDDRALEARFGPWRVHTDTANILGVEVTGPYAFLKTVGPARLAVSDRGLTFASNGDRGVLITFRTPVPGLEPLGLLRHPELTVTVTDVQRLAALIRARTG
jgi:hypothetical protein